MLLERLFILGIVVAVGALALGLWRRLLSYRLQQLSVAAVPLELNKVVPTGPALLYFTTQQCVQCRLQQTPILAQLTATIDIPLHTLDAIEAEALTRFFGIMTVPTTIWLDQSRHPVVINHGLTDLAKLRLQAQHIVG